MRKTLLFIFLSVSILFITCLSGCSQTEVASAGKNVQNEQNIVRIGYQKNCPFVILKGLGTLEEQLEPLGFEVEWKEFQSGPALMEAFNAGSIDVGRTGNSPIVFAQAAGTSFVSLAAGKPKFHGSGILVHNDSSIKEIGDLKGKTVSFAKGSSSHYLIVKALQEAGLSYSDITPAYLSPGDARVAFEQGNVDAMVVWDPFTASTELNSDGVLLTSGEGLSTDRDFFIATDSFASEQKDIANIIIEEVEKSSDWANNNHDELVSMLAPILNIDEASIKMAVERRFYGIDEINDEVIAEQQDIADSFYDLDIIPTKIDVSEMMK